MQRYTVLARFRYDSRAQDPKRIIIITINKQICNQNNNLTTKQQILHLPNDFNIRKSKSSSLGIVDINNKIVNY